MKYSTDIKLRLLKDTIIVNVKTKTLSDSGLLFLPENSRGTVDLVQASVRHIGSKFRFKDDVKVGDIVYVPEHFGTVIDIDHPTIKIYDGEDVHAIVKTSIPHE